MGMSASIGSKYLGIATGVSMGGGIDLPCSNDSLSVNSYFSLVSSSFNSDTSLLLAYYLYKNPFNMVILCSFSISSCLLSSLKSQAV